MASRRATKAREAVVTTLRLAQGWVPSLDLLHATRLSFGRLYAALETLEADGFIASTWQDGPPPRRRLYRLIPAAGGHDDRRPG